MVNTLIIYQLLGLVLFITLKQLINYIKNIMTDQANNEALDTYSLGWARRNSAIIYRGLDNSYTFSGLPNMEPVDKINFKMFWVYFRSNISLIEVHEIYKHYT